MRLTPFSRLLIVAAVIAGLFFGVRKLIPGLAGGTAQTTTETTPADSGNGSYTGSSSSAPTSNAPASGGSVSTGAASPAFTFVSPEPVNGVLKGVVEVGASGFNSFIVRVDNQKHWKLEKSEFGNSLVTENMASSDDIKMGLKKYIGTMLDFGVSGKNIHFVVSSGAQKAESMQKIIKALQEMKYYVNTVTPEEEGKLGFKSVMPDDFEQEGFVADIGSGNTKITWMESGSLRSLEAPGAKYFQNGMSDDAVYGQVKQIMAKVPAAKRKTCFIIGGIPFELAKQGRNGKERYTVLKTPTSYTASGEKQKAGINIYKALTDGSGCNRFVFDWDANFTIGFLLNTK